MKKITKKLFSLIMVFAMMFSYFAPVVNVFALSNTTNLSVSFRQGENQEGKVQYSLNDGATWIDVTENINQNISVTGDNLRIKIVPNENYSVDYAGIEMRQDGNQVGGLSTIGFENDNGYAVPSNVQSVQLSQIEFGENQGGQQGGNNNQPVGNNTRDYQGNSSATLTYSVNGVVEYDVGPYEGLGINFSINGIQYKPDQSKVNYTEDTAYERDEHGQLIIGDNNQPIPILDPETNQPMTEKTSVTVTGDTIHYDSDSNKVRFVFVMNPGTLMTGLVINGQTITNLPSTSEELLSVYDDHKLVIEVDDIDKADDYNIEITARYPNSNEEFMGNFLWDYNPQGYTGPEDKILNGTLEFVSAEYNGHVYTTPEEINALGGVYIWQDAPRKKTYTDDREGCGEAQFPKGTILTVKIIPDAGYQLIDFGINGGVFDPQEEIGTYSFTVEGGPFHLQATIDAVDDKVNAISDKISAGAITLGDEESMSIGTARLDVKDVELSSEQISNFKGAADGYNIENYLDISLYNTVYKGSENQSWDTKVEELDNEAEISLQLDDDVNGKDIIIVHEKHDGTYEIIETEYLEEYNAIVFKTDSFSNYAIAVKDSSEKVEYKVDDENGNSISFKEEEGHTYTLSIFDWMTFTDEDLAQVGITREEFNEGINVIKELTKNNGELISFLQIDVVDEHGNEVHNGPLQIKIKMTDKMKKYNTFKLMYIDTDNEFATEEAITLTQDGDYLIGTLPHLSTYALSGSYVETTSDGSGNPKTGDNVMFYISLLGLSIIGLVGAGIYTKKRILK